LILIRAVSTGPHACPYYITEDGLGGKKAESSLTKPFTHSIETFIFAF
jgi:hypothetical protein